MIRSSHGIALCMRAVNLYIVFEHVAVVFLLGLAGMAANAGFTTA